MLNNPCQRPQNRVTLGAASAQCSWTEAQVQERLAEAAHTIRRMPLPKHGKPDDFHVSWPDVVYDWLAYGWTPARAQGIRPTPAEVSRMDEVLQWLHWLTRDQRLIVWARANHWGWRKLEALDELERNGHGRREQQLRRIMHDGHARILAKLNGTTPRAVTVAELTIAPASTSPARTAGASR